jgi:hypothetical protein
MAGTIYEEDFCREKCVVYQKTVMRSEGYKIPELIEQQKQKISLYCQENCSHTREEFIEWMKARQPVV